jgi:CHASE2 domain-containing sensor protein
VGSAGPLGVDGFLLDVLISTRALQSIFAAGARVVGFAMLFAYSANQFIDNFDQPFLFTLGQYQTRIVLGRSGNTLPAAPFMAALRHDPASLGLIDLPGDYDGKYRRIPAYPTSINGKPVWSLAQAVLQRAEAPAMPDTVFLTPTRHLRYLPTYGLIDILRCARQAPEVLQQALAGKIVLIGSTLAEEDRWSSSGRLLPWQQGESPLLHSCGLRRLQGEPAPTTGTPGVFLHAAAIEAVVNKTVTHLTPAWIMALLVMAMAALGAALGMYVSTWLAGMLVVGLSLGL